MKKVLLLLISTILLLSGCSSNKENVANDLLNKIKKTKSYKLEASMEINNDEESFMYNVEVYYLKDGYYKVRLVNETNNHEQIILKNNEDVYVITPELNKSYKFQSEWPNNSSQAYLLGSIANDIENDKNKEIIQNDNTYIIKTKVNYPNNPELKYQKIYINNDNINKIEVYNEDDIVKIKVVFSNIDYNANIEEKDFNIDNYIKEEKEPDNCVNEECKEEKKTANIDSIIYPLYIPSNTYLANSEKINTNNGNRVILTFTGEKNFVLIEEAAIKNNSMELIPVYGEPLMLADGIGALSVNSLSFDKDNISYYLASSELTTKEMQKIANSLGNETLVANTK